jgi:predicted secreted protein
MEDLFVSIESLNHALPRSLTLHPEQSTSLLVLSYPSTGYLPRVHVEGGAVEASLEACLSEPLSLDVLDTLRIGGPGRSQLNIRGIKLGSSRVSIRFERPWVEKDPDTIELSIEVVVA